MRTPAAASRTLSGARPERDGRLVLVAQARRWKRPLGERQSRSAVDGTDASVVDGRGARQCSSCQTLDPTRCRHGSAPTARCMSCVPSSNEPPAHTFGLTPGPGGLGAVSYTHLRAHETDSYLVCRL